MNAWASTENEIKHLLAFVKNTNCKYERNGSFHSGEEAVAHINKKYKYYADEIRTAEDFIKYSATKSKMSGKCYRIHCQSKNSVNSQE